MIHDASAIAFSTVLSASVMGDVKLTRGAFERRPRHLAPLRVAHGQHRPGTAFYDYWNKFNPCGKARGECGVRHLADVQTIHLERPIGVTGPMEAGFKRITLSHMVGAVHWQWRRLHLSAGVSVDSNAKASTGASGLHAHSRIRIYDSICP